VGEDGRLSAEAAEIEQRLAHAAEHAREYEIVRQRRDDLHQRAEEMERQVAQYSAQYEAEQHDVARLERLSLTRIIASLRGSRDDDLAREQAEAEAARYRAAEARARLEAIRREQAAAQARLDALASAPQEYESALSRKESYLRDIADPRGEVLLRLAEERGRLTGDNREIREAIAAADGARQALEQVRAKLGSAASWSTYDTWFGGGMLGSAMKHSRMDEAAAAAAHADRCLAALRTELADVEGIGVIAPQIALDGMTRFVDIWLDNIFTDLAVGERIRQAQRNVARSEQVVRELRARLEQREARNRARLVEIESEREALLTQA